MSCHACTARRHALVDRCPLRGVTSDTCASLIGPSRRDDGTQFLLGAGAHLVASSTAPVGYDTSELDVARAIGGAGAG